MCRSMVRGTAVSRPKISGMAITVGSTIAGLLGLAVALWLGR